MQKWWLNFEVKFGVLVLPVPLDSSLEDFDVSAKLCGETTIKINKTLVSTWLSYGYFYRKTFYKFVEKSYHYNE